MPEIIQSVLGEKGAKGIKNNTFKNERKAGQRKVILGGIIRFHSWPLNAIRFESLKFWTA